MRLKPTETARNKVRGVATAQARQLSLPPLTHRSLRLPSSERLVHDPQAKDFTSLDDPSYL